MTIDHCPHCPCMSSSSPHSSITFHTSGSCSFRDDEDGLCRGDHATWRTLLRVGFNLSCNLYSSSFPNDKKSVLSDKGNKDSPMYERSWPTERMQSDVTDPWPLHRVGKVQYLPLGARQSLGTKIVESTCSTRASKVAAGPNSHLARVCKHDARRRW